MRVVMSISLPEEIAKALEERAKILNIAKSDLVREALRLYLWEERFNFLRKKNEPLAKLKGLLTDEEVFKKLSS